MIGFTAGLTSSVKAGSFANASSHILESRILAASASGGTVYFDLITPPFSGFGGSNGDSASATMKFEGSGKATGVAAVAPKIVSRSSLVLRSMTRYQI